MKTNRDVKVGDYVEVKFRGEVTYNDIGGSETLQIAPDYQPDRKINAIEGHMVTVIPHPLKNGDVITGEQARDLPVGSVVLYEPGGGASIKLDDKTWVSPAHEGGSVYEPTWFKVKLRLLHVGGPDKRDEDWD